MIRYSYLMAISIMLAIVLATGMVLPRGAESKRQPNQNFPAGAEESALPRSSRSTALPGPYRAQILRVIDGDTIEARIAIWLGQDVTSRVRLAGIDAPELSGGCPSEKAFAGKSRDALAGLLEDRGAFLTEIKPDKFGGRVVAKLWNSRGEDIGAAMVESGMAVPYAGRRRSNWCSLAR